MTDSWDLKLDRAEEHLSEFKALIAPWLKRCINPVVKGWETYNQQPAFVYRVRFAHPEPDERLAVVAGDVMHNIRSALDHAAVALVSPASQFYASFPIFTNDLDAVDEDTGDYLHVKDRRNWRRSVQDMPDRAVEFLRILQPYVLARDGQDAEDHALALLSAFQNADKHRKLTVIAQGIKDPEFWVGRDGRALAKEIPPQELPANNLMKNHAIVHFDHSNPPAKMEMEVEGTPQIVIGGSMEGPLRDCPIVFDKMLTLAREIVRDLATQSWAAVDDHAATP